MKNQVRFLVFLLFISFVTTTWIFWISERGTNSNVSTFFDVVWWWVVTSTTVGYGDISPITHGGRLAGVVAIIIGIYSYTNFITITAGYIHERMERHKLGTAQVNCKDHIVVCEYTAFADELLQVIHTYPELAKRDVVVVTDLVGLNPYPEYYYVRGVPLSPTALAQANIQHATYIFVFSNARFQEPDLKTLHIVSRIQKLNKHATMFVEMHKPQSEFTKHLTGSIIVLKSRDLLESVLQHQPFDLTRYLDCNEETATPSPVKEVISAG